MGMSCVRQRMSPALRARPLLEDADLPASRPRRRRGALPHIAEPTSHAVWPAASSACFLINSELGGEQSRTFRREFSSRVSAHLFGEAPCPSTPV